MERKRIKDKPKRGRKIRAIAYEEGLKSYIELCAKKKSRELAIVDLKIMFGTMEKEHKKILSKVAKWWLEHKSETIKDLYGPVLGEIIGERL